MSAGERHTPYHELLESLAAEGCAVCRLSRRSVSRYLDSISYESVTDEAVRDKLRDARGLCRRHGVQYLTETRDPLGLAIINRDILGYLLRLLEGDGSGVAGGPWLERLRPKRAGGSGRGGKLADALAPSGQCPACDVFAEAEVRFASTLAEYLSQTDIREAFERNGSLCLPHFGLTARSCRDEGSLATLVACQRTAMSTVEAELGEYVRKSDYRFRHESLGAEKDSPDRSVDLLKDQP